MKENENWEVFEDGYGIYKTRTNAKGIVEKLTEYKQKWYDENPPIELEPQPPTLEEQLADKERQILELKENQFKINRTMEANVSAQQELLELLIDMGVL